MDSPEFLNQGNPGNTVKGKVVFDIAKDAKITRLELHDSPFSQGAPVCYRLRRMLRERMERFSRSRR